MIKKSVSILVFMLLISSSVFAMGATFAFEQSEYNVCNCLFDGNCCTQQNNDEPANGCCEGSKSISITPCGGDGTLTHDQIISDEQYKIVNIDVEIDIDDTPLACSCGGPNCQTGQCQPCKSVRHCKCGRTACACKPQCVKYPNERTSKCQAKSKACNCGGPNCPCQKKGYCEISPDGGLGGKPPCGGQKTNAVFNCKTQGCKGSNCRCGPIRVGICGARVKCGWPSPHDCKTYGCKHVDCTCGNFCGKPPCKSGGKFHYVGVEAGKYLSIQDAIDESSTCDIIYVSPGTYYENIEITRGITLRGEGRDKTIIHGDGSKPTVLITADGVTFTGFSVVGGGTREEDAGLEIHSNYCTISDNQFTGNGATGINLRDSANFNTISENVIMDNLGAGIFVWEESDFNSIFLNNFGANSWFNAKDYCDNYYDNSDNPTDYKKKMCGNNWEDYEGSDNNGDGIGDSPYLIQGGSNQDNYPLMNTWSNNPPETPTINGTSSGTAGVEYDYTMSALDPDNHEIILIIDWGDGSFDEWLPTASGEEIYPYHNWSEEGTYAVRVKAVDPYGAESDWATQSVTMPKNRSINIPFFTFLKNHPNLFPILQRLLGLL
jgi:parallel beta-helix repeat protein